MTDQKLITKFGSLQKLVEASVEELSSIKGIGLAKAAQIKAVFEIARRLSTQTPSYKSKELIHEIINGDGFILTRQVKTSRTTLLKIGLI